MNPYRFSSAHCLLRAVLLFGAAPALAGQPGVPANAVGEVVFLVGQAEIHRDGQ